MYKEFLIKLKFLNLPLKSRITNVHDQYLFQKMYANTRLCGILYFILVT